MTRQVRILATGPSSTVQDVGRPGWFHAGVGVAGAADQGSYALANRLVANDPGAAAIECLLGGLQFTVDVDTVFAVTGAPVPITVDGTEVGLGSVIIAPAGALVALGTAPYGLRAYVALRGGIDVAPVLGSRSYDSLSHIGPSPLAAGTVLPLGVSPGAWPVIDHAPLAPLRDGPVQVSVILGPRHDWFRNADDLFVGTWSVSPDTDRVGMRLIRSGGPDLRRLDTRELPSEGMALGSIQVPPGGEPVIFLADHPVTGGYPVVGTVVSRDIDALSQARPGQCIEFTLARG